MLKAKLCGMKTVEAARAAETAGADFIGFIFWRRSHRFVEPEQAARIAEALQRVKTVGVFVDEKPALVNAVARQCHLDFVQLHGHEDAAYAEQMEVPVIKAYRYGDGFSAEAANAFPAAMILVDAYQKGAAGGTVEGVVNRNGDFLVLLPDEGEYQTFEFGAGVDTGALEEGDCVSVTYTGELGKEDSTTTAVSVTKQ